MQPGADAAGPMSEQQPVYRVYKVRYLGLAQLVLLNIIISWDVCIDRVLIQTMRQLRLAPDRQFVQVLTCASG